MKISVIGGTGFVGQAIVERLVRDGHQVKLLVRAQSQQKAVKSAAVQPIIGSVTDSAALRDCLADSEAVIYLIGLLREFPKQGITFDAMQRQGVEDTIAAAQATGVKRFLLMSANGVDANQTAYQRTKLQAEQALKQSALQWTIFRPSVIFGDPKGRMEFCSQLKAELIDPPVPAPLFFAGLAAGKAGQFELAPVWIDDVAAAFVQSLARPETVGKTYALCGPDAVSWKTILTTIATAAGRPNKRMLPAPVLFIKPVAGLMDRFAWFPVTRDQLTMLVAGNLCQNTAWEELGVQPTAFSVEALGYLA